MSGLKEPEEFEPEQGSLRLASPDDNATTADWEKATAAVLRKARRLGDDDPDDLVWQKLTRTTLDGIDVPPIGSRELAGRTTTSGRPTRAGDWDIRSQVTVVEERATNEEILVDLDQGVTSLWLDRVDGVDLAALLDGVLLDLAPVVLDGHGDDTTAAARAFIEVLGDTTPADGTSLGAAWDDDQLVDVARLALDAGTLAVVIDGTTVHDRGASDGQELGWSLAAGIAALRTLTDAGIELDEALGLMEFRYAATDEQFPTIAKLRAARRLWARVVELSGSELTQQRQHVVTSRPMMSAFDPWVNMLRTTVASFAAGVAGADSVTVLPFDSPLGVPDALGRRVARNTSSLLISESHVAHVADPAGGAYAVEKLTDDLAHAAWAELGRIEADGLDALDARIAAVVAERDDQIAHRTRPITGLSEFPNLGEKLPERSAYPTPHDVRRYGAAFEDLRGRPADRPVFLATMGTVAQHTARATFAANLFAAGGVTAEPAGATTGVDDLIAAYDGQQVACLAGTDAAYSEWGAQAVRALRDAGAAWVILAGKGDVGADDSCAVGVDALTFLATTREKLA
ncbi:methylmalonyl-CoA mutase family protein [Nocardioides sp. InS609-2]|uniref:methylmalonyl-CoA mutase family protein n=1 Tax=Nocardioides sp. InS609-2 TaxID=2760705 RepID=UPI0020BD802E|nr:methylmalonyl-CoA mutase family protein [Nocardioides sp. InS609-2]